MHSSALFVVCVSTTFVIAVPQTSINYCGSRMCGNTNAHTFCQYPEGPSRQCMGYISASLTNEEKSRVIARLNRRRNETAAGRLRGLPSAGNMLKLRWVEELAREAQRWADQCRPPQVPEERDVCRDLYAVPVGQCVASVVGEAPGLRVESMVDIWYMQNILYKGNVTHYVPPNLDSSFYGDFGQMMWAQSYMVGCGRSRFMTEVQGRLRTVERLVCNIAPRGPAPSRPLWSPSVPVSLCPSRSLSHANLNALCDIQIDSTEIYEVDASMTLEEQFLLYTVLDMERNESLRYPGSLDELYLTRIAIATIDNIVTTETNYNSMQKRDVVEMIDAEDLKTSNNISRVESGSIVSDISTLPTTIQLLYVSTKKKMSLIGRPKSYNMEELTDMDYKIENYSPSEDTTKKEKDFYAEYEFVENMEENSENSTNKPNNKNVGNTIESISKMDYGAYGNVKSLTSKTDYIRKRDIAHNVTGHEAMTETKITVPVYSTGTDEEHKVLDVNTDSMNLQNSTTDMNINYTHIEEVATNISFVPDNALDYLSDQETVRELQEALEVMERDISTEYATQRQGKVRRELRQDTQKVFPGDKLADEYAKNRSLENKSIYNKVLQYMPYLRDYQNGLLSNASGRSAISFVVVLSMCLYV